MGGRFEGLTAAVTGGASGIGAAVVAGLLGEGAEVAVLDLNIADANPTALGVAVDVGDYASARAAIERIGNEFGRLDILINNAGIAAQGTVETVADAEWARVLSVNVTGIARMTRAALPLLRCSSAAAIVNTCSVAAVTRLPERALYSASKGAVLALTRAMAADHLVEGIRVNCVNPGTADTPWIDGLLKGSSDPVQERTKLEARQPHGRLVSASEVADAILYLASPGAGSTTGTSLAVDGGLSSFRIPSFG